MALNRKSLGGCRLAEALSEHTAGAGVGGGQGGEHFVWAKKWKKKKTFVVL